MRQFAATLSILVVLGFVTGCSPRAAVPVEGKVITDGTVTQISGDHGNVYTDIKPAQYDALKLRPGQQVLVNFGDRAIPMTVGRTYTDVQPGQPVAVLHREGLTFAIRDASFSTHHRVKVGDRFTISRR